MKVRRDASLHALNTFGVDARAAYLVELHDIDDVRAFATDRRWAGLPALVLGGGSNILLRDDFPGVVGLVRITGRHIAHRTDGQAHLTAAGGEDWHELVRWSLDQGLGGLENLSLIPGCAGAAPMQNIGAYGVELSERLAHVDAVDLTSGTLRRFTRDECGFGYRTSIFKQSARNRYFIVSLGLTLSANAPLVLHYPGVREELECMTIENPTHRDVSDAICNIRRRKLPDTAELGNAGSFFKNPIVDRSQVDRLRRDYPALPTYELADGRLKLSAAWLVENCGWRGYRQGQAGVYAHHALVLVNHGNATGAELWALAERIRKSVKTRFAVSLEPEPLVV